VEQNEQDFGMTYEVTIAVMDRRQYSRASSSFTIEAPNRMSREKVLDVVGDALRGLVAPSLDIALDRWQFTFKGDVALLAKRKADLAAADAAAAAAAQEPTP
jgi:hypothetical protein